MLLLKLLGACFIVCSGWYCGVAFCSAVTMHRKALEETIALLKLLQEEITFRRVNLTDLFWRLQKQGVFINMQVTTKRMGEEYVNVLPFQQLMPPNCFLKEEKVAFVTCFTHLGYTGALQECERLARYQKQFEKFYQIAIQNENRALAIDRKIGLAIGSMVALMLL